MRYRICKAFEVESGHMLSKHPSRCRFPHGHSRRIEVVLSAASLDENDMVCDFKALRLAIERFIDEFDHAMAVNSDDPSLPRLREQEGARLVVYERTDPTTEVMARHVFDELTARIASGETYRDAEGSAYRLPEHIRVERVRVGETSSSWAEYGVD